MDAPLRQKTCHTCHQLFAICVACDRGVGVAPRHPVLRGVRADEPLGGALESEVVSSLRGRMVSGWNTRRLARQTALREDRLRVMTPALDEAERRIAHVMLVLHNSKAVETLYEQEPRDRV
jgi:hypothetical protein